MCQIKNGNKKEAQDEIIDKDSTSFFFQSKQMYLCHCCTISKALLFTGHEDNIQDKAVLPL